MCVCVCVCVCVCDPLHLESLCLEGVGDAVTDDRQEDVDSGK